MWKILIFILIFLISKCHAYLKISGNRLIDNSIAINRVSPHHLEQLTLKANTLSVDAPQNTNNIMHTLSGKTAQKITSWSLLGLAMYALRPFYGIMLGTFFLSYLANSATSYLEKLYGYVCKIVKAPTRAMEVPRQVFVLIYMILAGLVISRFCLGVSPQIVNDWYRVLDIVRSDNPYRLISSAVANVAGEGNLGKIEAIMLALVGEKGRAFAGYDVQQNALDVTLRFGKLLQYTVQGQLESTFRLASRLISNSTQVLYKFLLSLIFSLLVVWDLPELTKGIRSLSQSRLGFAYNELAPVVGTFGKLVGQSFEVTALIAFVNCVLTTIGLGVLNISGLGFFSILTFVASFIPVAGIFIATFPPLVVALIESGVVKCVQLLIMVAGVHAVESYLLYPQIYALKLKMHPLIVLTALAVAEHFAGIQGLFLAIPLTLYFITEVLFETKKKKDKGV